MKTIVIWDTVDADIQFFIVYEDWSRFNGVYVNTCQEDKIMLADELIDLVFDDNGEYKFHMLDEFPSYEMYGKSIFDKPNVQVIKAGCIP